MSLSSGGGASASTKSASPAREQVGQQTRQGREVGIKDAKGDLVGNNYVIPKGDFAHFLGYKPPTKGELDGSVQLSSRRVIEVALQKEVGALGEGAARNGNQYRNVAISWGRFAGEPGREGDMVKSAFDAVRQGPEKNSFEPGAARSAAAAPQPATTISSATLLEKTAALQKESHNDNVRLLEMQYRFLEAGKNDSVISNLMKVRNDAVTRSIRGGQG